MNHSCENTSLQNALVENLQDQALNGVFFQGGIPAAMEQFIAPAMEPDYSPFCRQLGGVHSTPS